jgi:hypothetical protein
MAPKHTVGKRSWHREIRQVDEPVVNQENEFPTNVVSVQGIIAVSSELGQTHELEKQRTEPSAGRVSFGSN